MILAIRRFFGTYLPSLSKSEMSGGRRSIEQLRECLQVLIQDCHDQRTHRVIYKINAASTAPDLWLLRSDLHQCISQVHNQAEAAARINSLIKDFEGWMPAHQLIRI